MAIVNPVDGNYYEIRFADKDWLRFKYDLQNDEFVSVDASGRPLQVFRYLTGDSGGTYEKQVRITKDDLEKLGFDIWAVGSGKESIVKDPTLNIIPGGSFLGTATLRAIMSDPMAFVLYNSMQAMTPYVECLAAMTQAITNSAVTSKKVIINKSMSSMLEKTAIDEALKEIRDSWLFKMINSPWFGIAMALFAVLLAVLAAIATAVSGGALLGVVIAIVALLAVGLGLMIASIVEGASLRGTIDEIEANLGDNISGDLTAVFDQLDSMIVAAMTSVAVGIAVTAIVSLVAGAVSGSSMAGKGVADVIQGGMTLMESASGAGGGMASGIQELVLGYKTLAMAYSDKYFSDEKSNLKAWEARSTYFSGIAEAFQESLKELMAHIDKIMASQSAIIKTLGDGSTAITRNLAMR